MAKVKLGDLYSVTSGGTPSKEHKEYYNNGKIRWVKTGDLKHRYLYDCEEYITQEGLINSPAKMYEPETVVIAMYGATIGAVSILKMNACTNQACAAFPKIDKVLPEYLYYFFKSQKTKFCQDGVGGAQPNISLGYLKAVEINLINIEEQKKIIECLSKIEDIIELKHHLIDELDTLIKARFTDSFGDPISNPFGWPQVTLKEISLNRLSYGSGASAREYDGNIRYVRITDINNNGKLNANIVSPSSIEDKYILNEGDILFARSGATVGKTYCYRESDGPCMYAGYLIRLIPDQSKVLPDYVFYYTRTSYYENFVASNMKIVAQPNINANQYGNLIICVPPMKIQMDFVAFVGRIEKLKKVVQESIVELQFLFDFLLQKYFRQEEGYE